MNIYDFDGTIYDGDSCKDIVLYGLKKYPRVTSKSLFKSRRLNKLYKKGHIEFEAVKEVLLSFIFKIPNKKKFINDFVSSHLNKIKPWYLSRKNDKDVIVSASHDIWISEFAKQLDIKHIICTKVDDDGMIIGKNCKRYEKVNRIKKEFPNTKILSSYSDSASDIPILELTDNSFVIEGNKIIPYKKGYKFKNNK